MADGKYVLPAPETITMTGEAARRLIGCGSGDAALLYLYILQSGGRFEPEDAAKRTSRSPAQIEKAMAVLASLGLVSAGEAPRAEAPVPPEELPEYSADDVARELREGSAFGLLLKEVQRTLGRTLPTGDTVKLFGIYDYLGLPPEVILQLVAYAKSECQRVSGPGRIPTMNYIEKMAFTWAREGLFSLPAAERYIMARAEQRTNENTLAAALRISGRALTASERKYLDQWAEMGFGPEAVAIAYDRTVLRTGKLAWSYMNKILKSWHAQGLHTPEEIEAGDGRKKAPAGKDAPAASGPTAEEVRRMKKALEKLNGNNS